MTTQQGATVAYEDVWTEIERRKREVAASGTLIQPNGIYNGDDKITLVGAASPHLRNFYTVVMMIKAEQNDLDRREPEVKFEGGGLFLDRVPSAEHAAWENKARLHSVLYDLANNALILDVQREFPVFDAYDHVMFFDDWQIGRRKSNGRHPIHGIQRASVVIVSGGPPFTFGHWDDNRDRTGGGRRDKH